MYIFQQRQFDSYLPLPVIDLEQKNARQHRNRLKIGIIGDSWAMDSYIEETIIHELLQAGFQSEVFSIAHPGVNSRQIYRNIFLDGNQPYSSRAIFMSNDIDYLIVVLGVNDTGGHIGKDFYAYHMLGIIKAAQERSMTPIILESPEFGIEDSPGRGLPSRVKRFLFRWLFDLGKVDVIEDYRCALRQSIQKLSRDQQPILLDFQSIIGDYHRDRNYYSDPSHLNSVGNQKLGQAIAYKILDQESDRKCKAA
jgi:lysophospholipase L1-like esterase